MKNKLASKKNVTAFINLSGGVDSTYYLWRWLNENRGNGNKILVHHCLFLKKRVKEEKQACDKILNFLNSKNLINFIPIETEMKKGTLRGRTLDIEMLCGMASIVVKLYPNIKDVLLPYSQEETSSLHGHLKSGGTINTYDPNHRYYFVNKVMELITGRQFNYIFYPDGEEGGLISKREMIQEMPQELFEMTWYCRRPVNGEVCGKCHTCRKVQRALKVVKK